MISLLHMSHRALKLNVYAAPSLATDRVVRLVFLERSSLSNPLEARCCIAPKECMHKEDVLSYVRPKPLLHSLGVPLLCDAVLCSSLVQGKRRGRSILSLHGKGNQKVYIMSSPTRTVLQDVADCTAFCTIRRPASPEAWCVSQFFFVNSSLSMTINYCLFCRLARNWSFFSLTGVLPVNVRVVPALPFDILLWVMSFVLVLR